MPATRNTRRPRRRYVPTTDLTVADVLDAPAEYTEAFPVRVSAPAVVLILERDAPARLELAGIQTHGEGLALQEWLRRDELAREVIAAYFGHNDDDPLLYEREDAHAERLEAGRPLSSISRVIERRSR